MGHTNGGQCRTDAGRFDAQPRQRGILGIHWRPLPDVVGAGGSVRGGQCGEALRTVVGTAEPLPLPLIIALLELDAGLPEWLGIPVQRQAGQGFG